MPEINASVPPWLQRNWEPKPSFDPSPWLQQAYKWNQDAQEVPLRVQGLALQNQAAQLAIAHQATENEVQGLQLQQYQAELPQMMDLRKQYANDPVGLMNHNASFSSPVLQKQWIDMQTAAAKSLAGIAATEQVKQKWVAARQLMLAPGAPEIQLDDQGNPTSEWIQAASLAKQEADMAKLAVSHPDFTSRPAKIPVIMEFGGKKFLVNTATGHSTELDKTVNKQQFVTQHLSAFMHDSMVDSNEAAKQLGELYDTQIAPMAGSQGAAVKPAASTPRLRYDPTSGKVVPVTP